MNTRFDFTGEVVVVTGGGSGIGAGFCQGCASAGATIIAADVDKEGARQVSNESQGPGKIEAAALDVGDAKVVEAFSATS